MTYFENFLTSILIASPTIILGAIVLQMNSKMNDIHNKILILQSQIDFLWTCKLRELGQELIIKGDKNKEST